ncbi:MAG: hypothetical protein AAGB25_00635 [Pseudomonadota bacterium]
MPLTAIGGIRSRGGLKLAEFQVRAFLSLRQARKADGNLHAAVAIRHGLHFSLSVWDTPAAMKRYAASGAHLKTMTRAPAITTESEFHHFICERIPTWDDALREWLTNSALGAKTVAAEKIDLR